MLKVSVISPERTLYEGEASAVVAPAFDGEVGVLTGHAPMMTLLGRGALRIESRVGRGTRVRMWLPVIGVDDPQPLSPTAAPPAASGPPQSALSPFGRRKMPGAFPQC